MANADAKNKVFKKKYSRNRVKFEIYGEELIEKTVNASGNSGRVYLPPEWIGTKVKVVRCGSE
ncbi:MAG: DUF2080 family transposase-associated protein [Desulfobacula sp.]|jgi:putative transposon-encoded protein|uniref:DUF2080 family transposase-associated protein n=1 Tax=Desulfobacula sp. TaxID=2593537 RepID=UPI001D3E5767|nr:DUF2080 family transposase-associated protein [Desulfobacula sp.]MBT3486616.1 DUF2080 family transposase-associated protein [Desulfobacula sp.]MBT3805679.1 DUF2080 family transposase-associated protein [Desulfobacula sp.]MBT4023893.1 DUF2080 family transposase-associated protein [Desulfobacula sp.]MBT4198981.1 DUF2080 family transposase-associated protein [Desulfobacula sp.]